MRTGRGTHRRAGGRPSLVNLARRVILPSLLLCLVAAPVDAQDRRDRRPSSDERQEMERRARAQMSRMIREELDLTEAEYEPISAVMDRYGDQRRNLARSERELRRELEALLEGRVEDTTEASSVLGRLVELREQEASIFREEQEALLEHLTPTQVLQLHSLREQISRRIRELRGRRGGGDGDRGTIPPYPVSL